MWDNPPSTVFQFVSPVLPRFADAHRPPVLCGTEHTVASLVYQQCECD